MPRSFLVKKKGPNRSQRPDTEARHVTATTPPQRSVDEPEIHRTPDIVNTGIDKAVRVDVIAKNSADADRQMSYRIRRRSNACAEEANAMTSEEEDEQERGRQNKLIPEVDSKRSEYGLSTAEEVDFDFRQKLNTSSVTSLPSISSLMWHYRENHGVYGGHFEEPRSLGLQFPHPEPLRVPVRTLGVHEDLTRRHFNWWWMDGRTDYLIRCRQAFFTPINSESSSPELPLGECVSTSPCSGSSTSSPPLGSTPSVLFPDIKNKGLWRPDQTSPKLGSPANSGDQHRDLEYGQGLILQKKFNALSPGNLECHLCRKSFATPNGLAKHQRTTSQTQCRKASEHRFNCTECDKVYSTVGALKMHVRTHTLPCRCAVCGKAFSRPWLLQGHMRTHTGERPFECPHCRRAFADRSNLRAHLQTHAEVKRYNCRRCDKTFSRMSLLTKHYEHNCSV